MKNIEKYQSLLASGEVDALLLTSEYNRLYAAQYGVAEGVAVVTKEGAYYFTDSRYIEAAENNLPAFTVRMTHPGSSDIARINEVIGEHTIKKLGFEEADMSYGTFLEFQKELHAVLVPMPSAQPRSRGKLSSCARRRRSPTSRSPNFRRSSAQA